MDYRANGGKRERNQSWPGSQPSDLAWLAVVDLWTPVCLNDYQLPRSADTVSLGAIPQARAPVEQPRLRPDRDRFSRGLFHRPDDLRATDRSLGNADWPHGVRSLLLGRCDVDLACLGATEFCLLS